MKNAASINRVALGRNMDDNRNLNPKIPSDSRIIARKLLSSPNQEGLPLSAAWDMAIPVAFCSDWRGENADPLRETEVRLLWSPDHLYIRFSCRYREIYVCDGKNGRRDQLWEKDVAELFVHRGTDELRHYREFEISPNGDWLDLDINAGQKSFLMCDLKSRVVCNADKWMAELAIPMDSLTSDFNPDELWRLNLFRIEGREPDRFYSAWRPTYTPKPNFHIPEHFGELVFASS
jgi:hypothetical protein